MTMTFARIVPALMIGTILATTGTSLVPTLSESPITLPASQWIVPEGQLSQEGAVPLVILVWPGSEKLEIAHRFDVTESGGGAAASRAMEVEMFATTSLADANTDQPIQVPLANQVEQLEWDVPLGGPGIQVDTLTMSLDTVSLGQVTQLTTFVTVTSYDSNDDPISIVEMEDVMTILVSPGGPPLGAGLGVILQCLTADSEPSVTTTPVGPGEAILVSYPPEDAYGDDAESCNITEECGADCAFTGPECSDLGGACETIAWVGGTAADEAAEILDDETVFSPFTAHRKETRVGGAGSATGRWSVGLAPESVTGGLGFTGSPPVTPGATYAVVGDVQIDVPDYGAVGQDVMLLPGNVVIVYEKVPDMTMEEYAIKATECAAYSGGFIVAAGAAVLSGGNPLAVGAALFMGIQAAICWAELAAADPVGYIECGIGPWGVQWGGTDTESDMVTYANVPPYVLLAATSDSDATETVYYDENGNPTGPSYIPIYDADGYEEGKNQCQEANRASKAAAEAAAQEYGSTEGDGDASIALVVDLSSVVDVMGEFQALQNNYFWSPVYGFAVGCEPASGCPLRLTLEVTQCGTVAVVGGSPAEVTYSFTGDPVGCPVTITARTEMTGPVEVPVPGIVLSMFYEGGGDDGFVGSIQPPPLT